MSPLFSSRAGISVIGGGVLCSATWPLGKITLDAETLTIDAIFKSYRLRIVDIDYVRGGLFTMNVEHHSPDVPGLVRLSGIGLFGRLREAIQRHQLRVEVVG
jgi:hypothetical protein